MTMIKRVLLTVAAVLCSLSLFAQSDFGGVKGKVVNRAGRIPIAGAELVLSQNGELYAIDAERQNILSMLGSGEAYEDQVSWMAETGELGLSDPDMKYVSRMQIRLSLERDSQIDVYVQYDLSGEWLHLCNIRSTNLRSFSVPIRPRRCDHMKLRFVGTGMAKIYSWAKTIEKGSERS